ncbi:Conserved oligomeric Golgi complex subunit 7 [Diplonema papillatum]|nr:Conserved oligomeric Golgi complex subunit 7 [Diplonema papillatum]
MPVWHEDEANALSSSSMHVAGTPLEYLRNIGDYLLSLPEVLGQARSGSDLTDDEHKWIQLVLQKSADYFVEQVIKIPKLSTAGLQQLATDVEYLENVIGYFEVEQPALKVLYLLVSTSDDGYAAVEDEVKQVLPSGSKLHALIAAKRFGTDQPPPPALPSPRESSPVPSQSSAVH